MCKISSESFFPTGKFNLSVATEHKMPPDSKYTCLESVRFVDLGSVCVFLVENLNPNGRMRPLRLKLGLVSVYNSN